MSELLQYGKNFTDFLVRRSLKHLILHVTNACNFRCRHCFVEFDNKRDLKLPVYQALGKRVGRLFWLDIGGGEPFLRKDLADIVAAFDAAIVGIPSNGSLPDQMARQLVRMKAETAAELVVSLSLDGLAETHNDIRGQDNWNQVWETFERLRGLGGVSLKITTVITNRNVDEIVPLMEEVYRHRPDFHSVILLRGQTLDPAITLPPLAELRRLGPEIFRVLGSYDYGRNRLSARILKNYHRYLWKCSLETLEQRTQVVPCLGGTAHRVLWGDGQVSSCEMLPPVGNLLEQSWDEIERSAAFRDQVQFIKDRKCHCTHNCAMLDSVLFNPRSMGRLLFPVEIEAR